MTLRVSNKESDASGILKFDGPTRVSMYPPCNTNKLLICPYTVLKMIPVAHMGSNRMIPLSSSTCVTVQSLHGFIEPLF